MQENGISIIVCSMKPELCKQMLESVKNTIGTNYETIIFDNRQNNFDICKVYNDCANKAKFPYLCFIHEDVIISTPNWGLSLILFAEKTQDCGVIGLAGGTTAKRNFKVWETGTSGRYRHYTANIENNTLKILNSQFYYNNPKNEEYSRVVTLDGFFLFVKREIWEYYPFDEEVFRGFHLYDADFSLGIAQKYQNYVCLTVDIIHFSVGNYNKTFYENARIFQKKWKQVLPCNIGKQKISMFNEIRSATSFLLESIHYGFTIKDSIKHFIEINGLIYFFVTFIFFLPIKIAGILIFRKNSKMPT